MPDARSLKAGSGPAVPGGRKAGAISDMSPGAFRSVLPLNFLNRGQGQHRWRLREYVGKKLIPIEIPIVVGQRLGLIAQLVGQQAGAGPVRLSLMISSATAVAPRSYKPIRASAKSVRGQGH